MRRYSEDQGVELQSTLATHCDQTKHFRVTQEAMRAKAVKLCARAEVKAFLHRIDEALAPYTGAYMERVGMTHQGSAPDATRLSEPRCTKGWEKVPHDTALRRASRAAV